MLVSWNILQFLRLMAYEWVQLGSLQLIIIIDFLIFIIAASVALISQKMHYLGDFTLDLWYFLGSLATYYSLLQLSMFPLFHSLGSLPSMPSKSIILLSFCYTVSPLIQTIAR